MSNVDISLSAGLSIEESYEKIRYSTNSKETGCSRN